VRLKLFLVALLLSVCLPGSAALIEVNVGGSWYTPTGENNLRISTSIDMNQVDVNGWDRVGAYSTMPVWFGFQALGTFRDPFALRSAANDSWVEIYPSSHGSPTGEMHFFGRFDNNYVYPNGIYGAAYDLSLTFTDIANDSLSALRQDLKISSASLYVSDQIGARAGVINNVTAAITAPVPEPSDIFIWLAGLILLGTSLRVLHRR